MALQGDDAKKFIQAQLAQGQKVQSADPTGQKDYGLLGNLIMQPLQQANRLGAAFGDFTTGFYKDKNNAPALQGDTKYLSDYDAEQYKNPLNIAKDAVGLASNFVPFGLAGKGIGAAIKGGAAIGAAQGFGNTYGQNTIEDTVGGTLTGAAGGAAGGLAMPLIGKTVGKLANKLKPGATKAAKGVVDDGLDDIFREVDNSFNKTGKAKANQTFKGMSASEIGVPMGKYEQNPVKTQMATQGILRKYGLPENLDGIVQGKERIGQQMDAYIDDIVRKDPKVTYTADKMFNEDFTNQLDNLIDLNKQITPEKLRATAARFMNQGKYGEFQDIVTKKLNVGDLKQSLQDINMGLQSGSLKGTEKRIAELIKTRIYETLGESAPKYKGLARGYATLASAENPTAEIAMRAQKTASTDPVKEVQARIFNAGKKTIGKAGEFLTGDGIQLPKSQGVSQNLEKLSNFLTKDGMPKTRVAQIVGAQAMLEMFDADGNGELDNQEQAMADESGMSMGDINTGSDMGSDSMESIYNDAFQMALQQTGGDAVKARAQAAAMVGFDPFDKKDSESKTPAKMQQQIKEMSGAETQLKDLLKEADKYQSNIPLIGGLLGKNPWDAKRKGYLTKLKGAMQDAATGMEGKSLTDADREYYDSFLPNENDTPEAFKESINAILETIATKKAALQQ